MAVITRQGRVRRSPANGRLIRYFLAVIAALIICLNVVFFSLMKDHERPNTEEHAANTDRIRPPPNNDDSSSKTRAIFEEAGVDLSAEELAALPSWSQIEELVGTQPLIHNLGSCQRFRDAIPGVNRNIGCSGMFNSGTNLVTQLLKENCVIPERLAKYGMDGPFHDPQGKAIGPGEAHGIRWQVPWGKHMPANYREEHATKWAGKIWKESVLAVVTVRHPYDWMRSMCKNHYTAIWPHNERGMCPNLIDKNRDLVPVDVKYDGSTNSHDSLVHLYNDWYSRYMKDADFPYVVVRFEDLQFYAKNVTHQICECAGGEIRKDRPFQHIVHSAKDGPGHGKKEERTGMVEAWIRYGKSMPPQNGFNRGDYEAAKEYLDPDMMRIFNYKHPPPMNDANGDQ